MVTPPDKAEEVLQAINQLRQSLEALQADSERVDKARDAKVDALGNYIEALRAQVESQGNALGAVVKSQYEMREGITNLKSRMDGFDYKLDGIRDDIGLVRGGHARNAMRQNLGRIVDQFGFKLISPVPQESVIALSKAVAGNNGSSSSEAESFGNADMIANVLDSEGKPSYLALEASYTVADNDVGRAIRNAAYLNTLTGLGAYAAVAGVNVLPEVQAKIDAGKVRFYRIQARELQSE